MLLPQFPVDVGDLEQSRDVTTKVKSSKTFRKKNAPSGESMTNKVS